MGVEDQLLKDHELNGANGSGIELNPPSLFEFNPPNSKVLWRSLFCAMLLLLVLPLIYSLTVAVSGPSLYNPDGDSDVANVVPILPVLLHNLVEEGLIKKGDRGLILGGAIPGGKDGFNFLRDAGIELITRADPQQKVDLDNAHQVFDFILPISFRVIQQADRIVKDNGLVILPQAPDYAEAQRLLSSYKIVYVRRFDSTAVAMRKMGMSSSNGMISPSNGIMPEKRRDALKRLEDVYLEPPRRVASGRKSRKIKFLPDLLKDSLDEYPQRVFISDDSAAVEWFYKNYPMRDQEFRAYSLDIADHQETSVSTWLKSKVKREDYVVMKAEAQVVEDMLKDATLSLVDELFLECNNQWQDGDGENINKRPYWACLTLYGRVRDEGIAVHQWWN